jgi:serine/threonine-protein kinase RsbW
MFPQKPDLAIRIPPKTELLKMVVELTKHLATINSFDAKQSQKIALAVDEAITNVIKHSYQGEAEAPIALEFYSAENGLKIRILFHGLPPQPSLNQVDLQQMIRDKRKGGLGVELMRRIMDSVEYSTRKGINCCEMVKWNHTL